MANMLAHRVLVTRASSGIGEAAALAIGDPNMRHFMRQHIHKDGAMQPEDVAAAVVFVASLPPRANILELLIRPTTDTAPL